MFRTLQSMIQDNWIWRGQIWRLAATELQKEVRGAVLGWVWLILTPAIYVSVFWFGLEIGLRTGGSVNGLPYVLWLSLGIIPWFFMSAMISSGSDVYHQYPYLINKLRFPLSVISSFYGFARFIVFAITMVIVIVAVAFTHGLSVYAVQTVFIAAMMYVFWTAWSMLVSPLSALSKDFHNLVKAMSTPLFWLSGTLFNVSKIKYEWIQWILAFNPITFFVTSFRAALCDHYWIWTSHRLLYPFLGIFVLTIIGAVLIQSRLGTEMADVL